jgi:ATPase subunit of ABC transporter with duplicated ATPase domains
MSQPNWPWISKVQWLKIFDQFKGKVVVVLSYDKAFVDAITNRQLRLRIRLTIIKQNNFLLFELRKTNVMHQQKYINKE